MARRIIGGKEVAIVPGATAHVGGIGLDLLSSILSSSKDGKRKGFDPQRVKNDILRAIADPAMSKEISMLTDELIENKRLKLL